MTSSLLVVGDAQAQALAHVLGQLDGLTASYTVRYRTASDADANVDDDTSFVVEQISPQPKKRRAAARRGVRVVTFPTLHFPLLWPLAVPNPGEPSGRRPWTESFIAAARAQNVPPEQILAVYETPAWSASWPDLDALFTRVTATLLAADAKADVKLGSFVLKHFRKRRLFWAPNAPSNALLGEMAFRVLHACFGREMPVTREALTQTVASLGALEIMARAAVPIHPMVAKHFALAWYDPNERYPSLDQPRTFDEYIADLVAAAYEQS